MSNSSIEVSDLTKIYRIPTRESGLISTLRSLISPKYNDVLAVDEINFKIDTGEIVGFIGPNGAGKTTTLKMLSGILHPTKGNVSVLGYTPWKREVSYLKEIGMVMGNKSQIPWDNTIMDSYNVFKAMYRVSDEDFKKRLDEFDDILGVSKHFNKFARNLSLGERMKCELVASLLHQPKVIFLDEPTLGLDVSMQIRMRSFIKEYNKRHNATIILTSHYMGDITSLCKRVIMINEGRILYDDHLTKLADKISPYKLIKATFDKDVDQKYMNIRNFTNSSDDLLVVNSDENSITFRTNKENLSRVVSYIANNTSLIDLSIGEPPIEDVIDQIYNKVTIINS